MPLRSKKKHTVRGLRSLWFPVFFLALFAVLIMLDIVEDLLTGTEFYHVGLEFLMVLAAASGVFYFWKWLRVARQVEGDLAQDLKEARAETTRWQEEERDLLHNLRKAITKQFVQWDFSPTEKEIAFCLLKGLSLREIANIRGSTFQSIRQQAHMLYRKAGLGGRAELSALFLGGLLEPDVAPDEATGELELQKSMRL